MIADAGLITGRPGPAGGLTGTTVVVSATAGRRPPARFQMGQNAIVAGNSLGSLPVFDQSSGLDIRPLVLAEEKAGMEEHRTASRCHQT
ncbi:hypothetical protein [Micromonospora sp. LOL_023]|uniref:hypothetical protein n=1 Tax=Micromonospora sp. LOL_023 TaxID=3345418 RepID=UPI003A861442